MPVPKPREGESKDDFISRCISFLHRENPDRSNEQNVAIAHEAWRGSKKASLTFEAVLYHVRTGEEKNLATFYLMNTSPNRLGWGVTDKALEEALPTLLGQTIGCGPGYKTDVHYPEPIPVGEWVSFDKPNGYALATAEIKDAVALAKIRRGEWGPISVVIDSYRDREEDDNTIVESFVFKKVDFVDVPAFPQAGFMNFAGIPGEIGVAPLELCAGFYESQSNGRGAGSLGLDSKTRGTKKKMEQELTEVKAEVETIKAAITEIKEGLEGFTELKASVDELKAGLKPDEGDNNDDDNKPDPELKKLQDEMKVLKDERHAERLAACIKVRTEAGLVKDLAKETERLTLLDDETLTILALDAGVIVEKMRKAAGLEGPKATRYTDESVTELEAAMVEMRKTLRLPSREADN